MKFLADFLCKGKFGWAMNFFEKNNIFATAPVPSVNNMTSPICRNTSQVVRLKMHVSQLLNV